MPISKGNQPINTFVKGLITEASPLTFPENSSLDESNFKLLLDGSRERRLGIDLEDNYAYYDMGLPLSFIPSATQSCFYWPSPNGSTKVDIGVVQLGPYLAFLNLLTANPSANVLNGGTAINTGVPVNAPWQFAIINNYLLAVNESLPQPYLISYNDETDVISYETSAIQIRDLYGVDDNIGVGQRPTTLTELHKYNLRNQGWNSSIVSTCGTDAIDCTFSTLGVYPSNSDQWGIGRIGDLTDANVNKYDPTLAQRNIVDGGQVPRGTYIIDLYNRGLSRYTLTGLNTPLDRENTYISTCASYAGRAWYSGIQGQLLDGDSRSPHLSNAVLYSQVFRNKEDLVKCYQEADPTSYLFNEVIDTDGGIVFISEAIDICRIIPVKQSLFVFARNGVWEIRGDEGGFRATSFQVNKLSSIGVYSPYSIIEANGTIMFWAIEGIYAISPNPQNPGQWDTQNITYTNIQKYYNKIPDIIKKSAKGFYDAATNQCRWLFTNDYPNVVGNPLALPATTTGGAILCTSAFNVSIVENTSIIQNGRLNNYTLLDNQVVYVRSNYDGGYKNITSYDGCTGALLKDFNVFNATGRYLATDSTMIMDANGIIWTQLMTVGVVAEPLWLNYNPVTDACTLIIPKDGLHRTDDSNIVNDVANNSVWINKSGNFIKRNINTGTETTTVPGSTSEWAILDTTNYRMWVININAALGDIRIYNASSGALLNTIVTTTPEDPFWAYYCETKGEMIINYYHAAGTLIEIYDATTYALKTSKNTSDYGANQAGRLLGHISTTNEYVMMLEDTVAGTTQLVFLNDSTLAINNAYDVTVLTGDALSSLMLALLTDSISAYTIIAEPGYINNHLVRTVRP